jgi:hypothetical protein
MRTIRNMSLSDFIQYTTLITALAAMFSVAFAVFSHRRQINASIYLDLSDRLHRLLQSVPLEMRTARLAGQEPPTQSPLSLVVAADFLHLMSSAHTLYRGGYFSGHLWNQLRAQAHRALRTPLFRDCWPQLRGDFASDPSFVAFVEKCQLAGGPSR